MTLHYTRMWTGVLSITVAIPLRRPPLLQFPLPLQILRKLRPLSRSRPPRSPPYIKNQQPATPARTATVILVLLLVPSESVALLTILAREISTCGQATAHYHGATTGTTRHKAFLLGCSTSPLCGALLPFIRAIGTQPSKLQPQAQELTTSCRLTNLIIQARRTWTSAPPLRRSTST